MSGQLSLDVSPARAWTRGRITSFIGKHRLAWELLTAGLTLIYVVLAFLQDQGSAAIVTVGVEVLAAGAEVQPLRAGEVAEVQRRTGAAEPLPVAWPSTGVDPPVSSRAGSLRPRRRAG